MLQSNVAFVATSAHDRPIASFELLTHAKRFRDERAERGIAIKLLRVVTKVEEVK